MALRPGTDWQQRGQPSRSHARSRKPPKARYTYTRMHSSPPSVPATPNHEDLRLCKRGLLLLMLFTPLVAALFGFAALQSKAPQWPVHLQESVRRGSIRAADGTIFAEGSVFYRRYPQGSLAAHIIGFSGAEQPGGNFGLEGLEYTLDTRLQAGEDIVITLDPALQAVAQAELRKAVEEFQAENGALVMIEAGTGNILAAASFPEYDPNNLRNVRPQDMSNRAFLQQVEPGSTIKPFLIAALLEEGRVSPLEVLQVASTMRVGEQTFRDVASHDSRLTPADILRYSSNVGTILLGQRFSAEELHAWYRRFHFGQDIGLRAMYTRPGLLNPWQNWVPQDHASVSIGQSISVTAVQLAAAYSIFANDGLYIPPRLIYEAPASYEEGQDNAIMQASSIVATYDESAYSAPAMLGERVISQEVAHAVRDMLVYTVEQSSLRRAKIPGVMVAGKSGTADIFDYHQGRYIPGDYTMSFAGFFPADNPRITAVVYLQRPRVGGLSSMVATPVFRAVGSETVALWGIPPRAEHYAERALQ